MQSENHTVPEDLGIALIDLCRLFRKQAPTDDLIVEFHPFAGKISGIKEGSLSAHARLEMGRLFALASVHICAMPGMDRIEPALRFHVYGTDFSELTILLFNDFVWDCPFRDVDLVFGKLATGLGAILARYPAGPVATYIIRGDGTGIFSDNREFQIKAASPGEARALFSLVSHRDLEEATDDDITEIALLHPSPGGSQTHGDRNARH